MKKILAVTALAIALALSFTGPVSAAAGGMPAAHGVDGRTFGSVVSQLAQSNPAALVAHVSGK